MTRADDPKYDSTNGVTPGLEDASAPGPVEENGQHSSYWVLSDAERTKGFVRPYRDAYTHTKCGSKTTMGTKLSETYAAKPEFYTSTFCCSCGTHFPVVEFKWTADGQVVGS